MKDSQRDQNVTRSFKLRDFYLIYRVREWHERFQEGPEGVEDYARVWES